MKLRKIISGAQTGADITGLECAKALGLETGGWVPAGWRTDEGPTPWVGEVYGCKESASAGYPMRTKQNVHDSDATIWVGSTDSPGYYCTRKACKELGKPLYENPASLKLYAEMYETLNWAGNRESKNPAVVGLTKDLFATLRDCDCMDCSVAGEAVH